MKMIDLTCTKCGAALNVNSELDRAMGSFCGNMMIIDKEVQEHIITNGFEFGYKQELGRIQARKDLLEKQAQVEREKRLRIEQERIRKEQEQIRKKQEKKEKEIKEEPLNRSIQNEYIKNAFCMQKMMEDKKQWCDEGNIGIIVFLSLFTIVLFLIAIVVSPTILWIGAACVFLGITIGCVALYIDRKKTVNKMTDDLNQRNFSPYSKKIETMMSIPYLKREVEKRQIPEINICPKCGSNCVKINVDITEFNNCFKKESIAGIRMKAKERLFKKGVCLDCQNQWFF